MAGICAAADDAGLVRGLLLSTDCNLTHLARAGYGALTASDSSLAAGLTVLLTLYVALFGLALITGRGRLDAGGLVGMAFKVGLVLTLATQWPAYQTVVFEGLFQGPEQLASSLWRAVREPGSALAAHPWSGLQAVFDELQLSASAYAAKAPAGASPLVGGPGFAAFALNLGSVALLLSTLGLVLVAKIALAVVLVLTPVAAGLLLFDGTRGLFEGWLRAAVGFALLPLIAMLMLVVQLALVEPQLATLVEVRDAKPLSLGPAMAVLILALTSAGLAVAGAVAAGAIAAGLKLPIPAPPRAAVRATAWPNALQPTSTGAAAALSSSPPSRAGGVAAAAQAMARRDSLSAGGADRRSPVSVRGAPGSPGGPHPLGQTYRRSSAPRRTAVSDRRDR